MGKEKKLPQISAVDVNEYDYYHDFPAWRSTLLNFLCQRVCLNFLPAGFGNKVSRYSTLDMDKYKQEHTPLEPRWTQDRYSFKKLSLWYRFRPTMHRLLTASAAKFLVIFFFPAILLSFLRRGTWGAAARFPVWWFQNSFRVEGKASHLSPRFLDNCVFRSLMR
jgi:hypothetical protein